MWLCAFFFFFFFFFFNDTATTEIYTLSLHDALPIFAVIALVAVDLGQMYLLLMTLRSTTLESGWRWLVRTGRAQLLWSLAAVISIEIILIEPWFLVPGIPLFVFGYMDIRARFVAERRARLLT